MHKYYITDIYLPYVISELCYFQVTYVSLDPMSAYKYDDAIRAAGGAGFANHRAACARQRRKYIYYISAAHVIWFVFYFGLI